MPQYDNPAAFMSDPSTAEGLPGLQGALAAQRQGQAAPFLDMFKQQMQMETTQKGQELQEFMGESGRATREAQRQKIMDEGNIFHATMQDAIQKSHEAARLRPYLTDEQIAKAKVDAQQHGHLFASAPSTYFSGMLSFIDGLKKQGATDEQIAPLYNQAVQNSGFPKDKLDPEVQTWGKDTYAHLAMHRMAQVLTPEYEQKLGEIGATGAQQQAVARIGVQGRLSEMKMQIDAGKFENMPRYRIYLNKVIATGVDPETHQKVDEAGINAARDSLRRANWLELQDRVAKDPLYQGTAIMAMTGDPEKIKQSQAIRAETEKRHMSAMGISPEDFGMKLPKTNYKVGDVVRVGIARHAITRVNPDGSYVVNVNGRDRTIAPKQ